MHSKSLIAESSRQHTAQGDDVANLGDQSLAANVSGDGSFGSSVSDNTLLRALHNSQPNEGSQTSSSVYIEPGQRQSPVQPADRTSSSEESEQAAILQQMPPDPNASTANYQDNVELTEYYRMRSLNCEPNNEIPQMGRPAVGTQVVNAFVRVSILLPGEPTTKTLANPRLVQSFKMTVPNNYNKPWYKATAFITTLLNSAQTLLEAQFPFPLLTANHFTYKLDAEAIYYSFIRNQMHEYHRMNLVALKVMDPILREEHMDQETPMPMMYNTIGGRIYDACYDISYIVCHVKPKELRNQPPNINEMIFLDELNKLVTQKVDAIGTIARLLTLYHDYRTTLLNPPIVKPTTRVKFRPATSNLIHPAHLQAMSQQYNMPNVVIESTARPPQTQPVMPYIIPQMRYPHSFRTYTEAEINQIRAGRDNIQQQMSQMYSSPYSPPEQEVPSQPMDYIDPTPPTPAPRPRSSRRHKLVLDATKPWNRSV